MASEGHAYGAFSGRPDHRLHLWVRANAISGNSMRFFWELYAERTGPWQGSFNNSSFGWSVNLNGQIFNGSHNLPFSASVSSILLGSGLTNFFPADAAGNLTIGFSAFMPNASQFGTAETPWTLLTADRIPKPPMAASVINGITDILTTTATVVFGWAGDDGGSPITGYETQRATDAAFTQNVGSVTTPGSPAPLTLLQPGREYFVRNRALNALGGGPWSNVVSFRTLSGAQIWNGSAWVPGVVQIWNGSAWVQAQVQIWNGSAWVSAG